MKQVAIGAVIVLSLSAMMAVAWQPAPALAGFTPTPVPPEETPTIVPTPIQPSPTGPPKKEKEAKEPTPTITTATPALLPLTGEQASGPQAGNRETETVVVPIIVMAFVSLAIGVPVYRVIKAKTSK